MSAGTRNPEPDTDFQMMSIALVGAGEAVAALVSAGDVDVDEAAELLINLFWRGLKGRSATRDAHEGGHPVGGRPELTDYRRLEAGSR